MPEARRHPMALAMLALFAASSLALGQDAAEAVTVTLESFVVSVETQGDGSVVERFAEASTAFPGDTIEYRLVAVVAADIDVAAGSLTLVGPVPEGTEYLLGSATPTSDELELEASLDGASFDVPPLLVTVTDAEGREVTVEADAADYLALRWRVLRPLGIGDTITVAYRVVVR